MHTLEKIKRYLPAHIELLAVSKKKSLDDILTLYHQGQRLFGENRTQELKEKQLKLPRDILWHFIGSLQRKNVKYIAPFIHLIQSVDSEQLLEKINQEAIKNNRIINVLIEIHIASEKTKHGFYPNELLTYLGQKKWMDYKNIKICGLMGMATNTDNQDKVKNEFQTLNQLFETVKKIYFTNNSDFKIISAGMSDDYQIAISQGSNMVRIGSALFEKENNI